MAGEDRLSYVIVIRSWFDRVNGNTYFGGEVLTVDTNARTVIPFQYGHGDLTYRYAAEVALGLSAGEITYANSRTIEVRVSRQRDAKLAV